MTQRREEADEFFDSIAPRSATQEEKEIQRRALAGMLWSKQIYLFDVDKWLSENMATQCARGETRNSQFPLAPPEFHAHSGGAGPLGVSVVCGLGPGI